MQTLNLSDEELRSLRVAHRAAKNKRAAYRINAMILLGQGWTVTQVAEALLLDEGTIRNYIGRYQQGGIKGLSRDKYQGSEGYLNQVQLKELDEHLQAHTYLRVEDVIVYVQKRFGVSYTARGMTDCLHRLGFAYKKPKLVPGKADPEAQQGFVEEYEKLKENKGVEDPIYFMDGVHALHNPIGAFGWIKKGTDKPIKTNTGRNRVNVNGAINIQDLSIETRMDDRINAESTVELLKRIEKSNPKAKVIYVICDNARYYRSKLVKEYLKDAKIALIFLPPYSPNLNLIERFWKFFKKKVLYQQYYETYKEFTAACKKFFRQAKRYKKELRSLLTENFHIVNVI